MMREALAANLPGAATFADGMDQLHAIRVNDPEHCRGGQEGRSPGLMGPDEAKEAGALG